MANEPALFDLDRVHLVEPTADDPDRFERRLLAILDREQPDLVVPCRDDDVVALASLRDRRPDLAGRLLCGNTLTANAIRDKWLSHEFCKSHDLPFVASIVSDVARDASAFVRKHGFPLLSKPRRGFSALGIHLLQRRQLLRSRGLARACRHANGGVRRILSLRGLASSEHRPSRSRTLRAQPGIRSSSSSATYSKAIRAASQQVLDELALA